MGWMRRSLRSITIDNDNDNEEERIPYPPKLVAQHCRNAISKLEGYEGHLPGSAQRAAAVRELKKEIISLGHELQAHPHRQRSGRYDDAPKGQHQQHEEAAATEAHEEETKGSSCSDDGYVYIGNRRVKQSTVAFRQSFAEAAANAVERINRTRALDRNRASEDNNDNEEQDGLASPLSPSESGQQRTPEWLALRSRRLTASAFSKALGFFPGDRTSLWEEKVGLAAPFAGNAATAWGTRAEPRALAQYQALTGQQVESCMFRVKHEDPPHSWLGASPDGLVQGLVINPHVSSSNTVDSPGVLEIKCPFNKGRPEGAVPPAKAIWYYMPQAQGLMDIFDRQWCSLYVWTPSNGSASFQVGRDREYWGAVFEVLAEFWWAHVVPARQAYDAGADMGEVEAYRPADEHPKAALLRQWSKQLADTAPRTLYPASTLKPM